MIPFRVFLTHCIFIIVSLIGTNSSPFSQFTTTSNADQCIIRDQNCHDLVFLIDISGSINTELNNFINIARNLSDFSGTCINRYGLAIYGSANTTTTPIQINGTLYFGTATEFNSYLQALSSLPSSPTSGHLDAYAGIDTIVETYTFRDEVERRLVLITGQSRLPINSTQQYTYENTLLLLTANNITLSVFTNGIQYYGDTNVSRHRLVGMSFNDQIGFGNYSDPSCSNDLDITSNVSYSVGTGHEDNFLDYVELAWNTNGTSFDLSYFNTPASSYCSTVAFSLFSQSILQGIKCDPEGITYTYASKKIPTNGYYTRWNNIMPNVKSSCVDMVFLVDSTKSMDAELGNIRNLSSELPENGETCINRYGLAIFSTNASRVNVGTSGYWGTPSELYTALGTYSSSVSPQDGYIGIDYVLRYYPFRTNAQRHIVLFTDGSRSILTSSLTTSGILLKLEANEVILSVVTKAENFNYRISSTTNSSIHAAVQYSNSMIGFDERSTTKPAVLDAYTPVYNSISNSNSHTNYVELAWNAGGIAFNLDFYQSTANSVKNSAIFNKLMFSYSAKNENYKLLSINASVIGIRNNVPNYIFTCETNNITNTTVSLIINGRRYSQPGSGYISVTEQLWTTIPGTYNFLCLANNTYRGNVWLGTFVVPELPISPFNQFSPNFIPDSPEISCDTYTLTSCVDLIFVIDVSTTINNKLTRIASLAGSLNQSYNSCDNRFGLTIIGDSNLATSVNISTNSQFGTPAELQSTIASLGSGSGLHDGYVGIHEAIANYQFRSDVQRKMVLFADQPREATSQTSYLSFEDVLESLLENDIILSVVTYGDTYSAADSQERLIGMTASNRIGYGNYSSCSTLPVVKLDTVLNAQYTIRNASEHYSYVELAWTTGGASYDMSYFESTGPSFCSNHLTDVFSFATLAETPCTFTGAVYSYANRSLHSTFTQWGSITVHQKSPCVDMVFLVDRTSSFTSYIPAIRNIAQYLPVNGDNCRNRYGLTIFKGAPTNINVGGTGKKWGSRSQLRTKLGSITTSGSQQDGLRAINNVINQYSFRNKAEKHIVLFTNEPRSIVATGVTKSSVLRKLINNGIILSAVTGADDFSTYGTGSYKLLAGVEISKILIGFGQLSGESATNINAFSPSRNVISDPDAHTNYVDLAWLSGGVAFDLSAYSGNSKYVQTSTLFNKLLFSYGITSNFSIPHRYEPFKIIATNVDAVILKYYIDFTFSCSSTFSPGLSISLIIDGHWYTNFSSNSIEIKPRLTHLTPGMYSYVCVANSTLGADSELGNYTISETPISPFAQFDPDFIPDSPEISCDTYTLTSCVDLIFVIDVSTTISNKLIRIASLAGSLNQSYNSCDNRFGLTIIGDSNLATSVNISTNSQFGTPAELQSTIASLGSGSGLHDGYVGIHEAIANYQFRSDVQRKMVLFADQPREITSPAIYHTYESTLLLLLENDIILSVVTYGDTYSAADSQERLIGMTASNRIGYGNYSSCSTLPVVKLDTVLNTQYTIRNASEHYSYVELAWTTGGASYDMSYFESTGPSFCSNHLTDVFSFATLAETPCIFTGAVYAYANRSVQSTHTQWGNIMAHQESSCVDMVFVVDRTVSMSSYFAAMRNIARYLPITGDTCANRFGLTIFQNSPTNINVGGTGKKWGSRSQLRTKLGSITTSGSQGDGLRAINNVINQYYFRNKAEKHIVLFTDGPRSVTSASVTKSSILTKLLNNDIILSTVTDADDFSTYGTSSYTLLAGFEISNVLIGFGQLSGESATNVNAFSPSRNVISDTNAHTNYVDLAWLSGGVAFDLSAYSGNSKYVQTSTLFNKLLFSYGTSSNFSIPHRYEPFKIITTNVDIYISKVSVEYTFSCSATHSPGLGISLIIDGEWYTNSSFNSSTTSVEVKLSLTHLPPDLYSYVCVANSSLGSDSSIANFTIVETPNYPFQQFGPSNLQIEDNTCGNLELTDCVDLVFIMEFRSSIGNASARIMELISSLPNTTNNCTNRYGLTIYGLATDAIIVNVSSNSYFGSAQQLNIAIQQNLNISMVFGAGNEDGYGGIHQALNSYEFRSDVKKRMVLFADDDREIVLTTEQYNYENTLLSLLQNDISLSIVSNGAEYYYSTPRANNQQLIGMNYNSRIGFGTFDSTNCNSSSVMKTVLNSQYSISNSDIYVSYIELAWSTNGAGFDLNYLKSADYCPSLFLKTFLFGVFTETKCDFTGQIFTYSDITTTAAYKQWQDINPQAFSNCVDMVFLVDRTASMNSYYTSIKNLAAKLPTRGDSCNNKYGLTLFNSSSTRYYVGGGSKLFGTRRQLASQFPISPAEGAEDGLAAIDYVIQNYLSSFRSNAQKHIVLFTDEPRSIVISSITALSVLNLLTQHGIILSVVTNADDFYFLQNGARNYFLAAIEISNIRIGFANASDSSRIIDAVSPILTLEVNSNTHTNYVDLAWETGGVAFDLGYYSSSTLRTRTSAVFNKLMFSWGGRPDSSLSSVYAPVLVTAINSTVITTQTGSLVHRFVCVVSSSAVSNMSLFVGGKWYSEYNTNQIEQSLTSDYPYPHPGSYNFICVANNSIGGDETLGIYIVPDTPRIYQQYSQFTYIPDSNIHCESVALESRHCVDAIFVIDMSGYSNTLVDRISSLAASLPTTAADCTNRYGLTVYGTSSLSQTISITNQGSKFGSPSQLSSTIMSQKVAANSSETGPKDGYEAIASVVKEYSFRNDVQKKIILIADEAREIDSSSQDLTFSNILQLLLTNGITLNTISNADSYHYYYEDPNNRLIGMHYNTRTGIGNYSSSCAQLNGNLGVVPSAEYNVSNSGTHRDYVELAWRSNGSSFDLDYFKESGNSFCSTLLDDIFQFGIIQNFPCTLTIVDYAFTTRTQFPSYIQWQDIQPQVQSTCVDMVFLLDRSSSMSSYKGSFRNLANSLPNNGVGCRNKYGLTTYERSATALISSNRYAERNGYFFPSRILYNLIPSSFSGSTGDGFVGIQYIIDNYPFRTDVVKSIVLLTDKPRSIVESRYTKSSILSALQSQGIVLSVITNADDYYFYQTSKVNVMAASYFEQTLVGYGYTGTVRSIIDAISPIQSNISNNNTHDNYVDVAWQTGGVAFNLDYYRSSFYYSSIRNSFKKLTYIWGNPAPLKITTLSFEFKGTYSSPSPYEFTCGINSVPHATLTLIIEGITYTQTETKSISQTLDLLELSPATYQFICLANNSNGGDSKVGEFTIKEPIPSPFSQFAYLPKAGRPCNTFDITNCVDLIFIVDISASINNELSRIAELAGNLPENSGACNNRYGFVIFGVQNNSKILNLTSNSLYGTPTQLKSVILNSRGLDNTIGYGPEDAYPAIHDAVTTYEFRDGVQRKIVLFADAIRQTDNSTLKYTYENTISLLLSNDITLSVVSYLGTIRYHNQASQNRLIGMKFFNNIGFGNFSSTINDSDLTVVSTPYFLKSSANIYHSYVYLAWDTKGSAFDMTYFHQSNTPYFPHLIARIFEFAVIQDVPCQFTDLSFNFDRRIPSAKYLYSRWIDIKPQMQSECVDMVFLIDRTGLMRRYLNVTNNLAQNLPENGTNCFNRYGLVSFESTAIISNIGGTNAKFGTADQLSTALSSFSLSGDTEDGYVGIDAILREYNFRKDADIRKHIILFTDEPRSIVNSSLTKSTLLSRLGENGFILSVVTDADKIYQVGSSRTRIFATTVVSESYVGFRTRGNIQQFIDAYSPVNVSKQSSTQHDSYVDLAWKTGGLAFDLAYFASSTSNRLRTVKLFQSLMYSWGTYVPLKIVSTTSEVKGGNIEVRCTTNNVPNVSISLIAGGQRFSEDNAISIRANLSLSNIDTGSLAYVCLANNSIGGDSAVNTLDIRIEHGPPINAILTARSSTSILVEWSPPILSYSSLFTYTVFYSGDPFDTSMKSVTTGPSTTRVLLINLNPYTLYSVYITAVTHFDSNQTERLTARTSQQAPTAEPEDATAMALNSTSLLIRWSPPPPIHQNGPIRSYTLSYHTGSQYDAGTTLMQITVSVERTAEYPLTTRSQYILTNLNPFNLYTVTIVARNDEGASPQTSVTERTLPTDSVPQITDPDSNRTLTEELSLSYSRTISCAASGYPLPTIRWYNSENEAVTNGPILFITVRNVTNDIVFICKAENRVGFVSRSVQIAIRVVDPDSTLDDLEDEIDVVGFNPEEAGEVADTIRLALPNTDNVPPEDVNKTREILNKGAGVNEVLLDKITNNNTALPLDDAERIVNTAGEIAVKDTELDAAVDTPVLSPEALNQGIISYASDALLITLRIIEKVCRNLGLNLLNDTTQQETILVSSKYVNIYGANLPIQDQPRELSLPINAADTVGESVTVSKDTMVGLADGQINVKIFVAVLNLDTALLLPKGSGTKHASSIVLVVIPNILTAVSLSKDATITLPTRARPSSIQSGTYLKGNVWATSGILTSVISENMTELETNHFTSFALFDTPRQYFDDYTYLSIISYVLSSISIIFLILSLLLFIFSSRKGFFKVEINILYFNLALALLIANGIFALYGIRASVFPDLFCKILAGIIHYSWITVFTWCLAFGIYIFYKLTCGIQKERKVYPYLIIFAWTVPLIFPIISIALKLDEYIDNTEHCFPSIKQFVVIGLVGPILILSIATILLTVVFSLKFLYAKKRIESEKQRAHIKHILTSTGVLSCFLIVPWMILLVYALLSHFEVVQGIELIEWVFVLLNDLMGIVFFFSIALRNKQVILLITRKQLEIEENRELSRRNVLENPTYGPINFAAENPRFNYSIEKNPGADYSIYADIGEKGSEKDLMEKKGISFNPYEASNNMACDAFPNHFDNELPPFYDQVAGDSSKTIEFANPLYGMGGEEIFQESILQDAHCADNPCLEDLKPEEKPSPIHPTGTRIVKENDYEV